MPSPIRPRMLLGMTTMSDTTPPNPPPVQPSAVGPSPFDPRFGQSPPNQPPPFTGWTPTPGWGEPARPALLRRSRDDRVAVGLAGGLGRYFGVDPVIFRVIFGVLALFGGSGIVLYLLGWAAIPDEGAVNAPVDRAIATLRRRHVPVSVVLVVGLIAVWAAFFSWWAPSSFIPALALVAVVAVLVTRGGRVRPAGFVPAWSPGPTTPEATPPGPLLSDPSAYDPTAPAADPNAPAPSVDDPSANPAPGWPGFTAAAPPSQTGSELRAWFQESRARALVRRQRRQPIERAALVAAIAVLGALGVRDVTHGVALNDYFFALGGIVFAAMLVGAALRRTPWPLLPLLVPAAIGVFVFGTTGVSAHDGVGDRNWTPAGTGGLAASYRIAFGRGTLDLTGTTAPGGTRSNGGGANNGGSNRGVSTDVRMGAGQLRIIVPAGLPVAVLSDVHTGSVQVDGRDSNSGLNFTDSYLSPAARADPSAARITVHLKLAGGDVSIQDGG